MEKFNIKELQQEYKVIVDKTAYTDIELRIQKMKIYDFKNKLEKLKTENITIQELIRSCKSLLIYL